MLDLDATDDPLHGDQEGRFFHGYYDGYCYLPLYVFCGRHLLAAKLRRSNIDASAGAVEEVARIVAPHPRALAKGADRAARRLRLRPRGADGVVRDAPRRLRVRPRPQQPAPRRDRPSSWPGPRTNSEKTGKPARRFKDFRYATRDSWSRRRRVIGKAEHLDKGANPRFVVTSLKRRAIDAQDPLRAGLLRPRRDGEPDQGAASSTCSPTAPRRRRWRPTSSGCGSRRSPTC